MHDLICIVNSVNCPDMSYMSSSDSVGTRSSRTRKQPNYNEEEDDDVELLDEEEEEEDEEDEEEEDDDNGEYSEQTPFYSENEEEEEEEEEEDFEQEEKPKPQAKPKTKFKVKLTIPKSSPLSKTVTQDDSTSEKPKGKKKATAYKVIKPASKRKTKAVEYDYDTYDTYEDEYNSADDIIPTPAIDDEGLSEDEEQYQPDVTKMTERQRAKLLDDDNDTEGESKLLSLSNKTHTRRVLTAEETELKKAEIARKRKNMLEKKLDEEKQDTINKLLKRRAVKTGTRKKLDDDSELEGGRRDRPRRPQLEHPALLRWVSTGDKLQLRVPEALLHQ